MTPGRRALTDIFPINPSGAPGAPLRFLQGQDGDIGGIVEARVDGGVEENIHWFRPTAPFHRAPAFGFVELPLYRWPDPRGVLRTSKSREGLSFTWTVILRRVMGSDPSPWITRSGSSGSWRSI